MSRLKLSISIVTLFLYKESSIASPTAASAAATVITKIEKRHPNFDGLNLTWESLEGIVKHNGIVIKNIPFHIKNYNNSFD